MNSSGRDPKSSSLPARVGQPQSERAHLGAIRVGRDHAAKGMHQKLVAEARCEGRETLVNHRPEQIEDRFVEVLAGVRQREMAGAAQHQRVEFGEIGEYRHRVHQVDALQALGTETGRLGEALPLMLAHGIVGPTGLQQEHSHGI